MKMQPKKNLRRFNNKRGISLVVAIALVLVLSLTTATFVSIAILQQKDTGITLSSRQAYVQTKSSLDFVEDYLSSGEASILSLPMGKKFYVFYYDNSGKLQVNQGFSTADQAKAWIEANKNKYKIIGNAYFKVEKTSETDDDGNSIYKLTAVGTDSTFSANDTQLSDLSTKFSVVVKNPININKESAYLDLQDISYPKKEDEDYTPISSGNSTNFFMVGMQVCHSLRTTYQAYGWGTATQNNHGSSVGTVESYNDWFLKGNTNATELDKNKFGLNNVNGNLVIQNTSEFPVVYNQTVKYETNGCRSAFYAYNNGFYFMGRAPERNFNYVGNIKATNACYIQQNAAYVTKLFCKYVVFNGDVLSKFTNENPGSFELYYYGNSNATNNGVIIYASQTVYTKYYNENGDWLKCGNTLEKGHYYWVKSGTDIMNTDFKSSFNVKDLGTSCSYLSDNDKDYIDTIVNNSDHMYSAYDYSKNNFKSSDGVSNPGLKVDFLNSDFTYNDGNSNYYSTSPKSSEPVTSFRDIHVYCAPYSMPSAKSYKTYYYMYAGDSANTYSYTKSDGTEVTETGSFNFMWYNTKSLVVEDKVNMSILSRNIVLTIGGGSEDIYKVNMNNNDYYYSSHEKLTNDKTTVTSSNEIKAGGTNASFILSPYWGEKECTITVKSPFKVTYKDDEGKEVSYEVKKTGEYDLKNGQSINLFSKEAETFFKKGKAGADSSTSPVVGVHDSSSLSSTDSSKNWTCSDYGGKGNDKFVYFSANSVQDQHVDNPSIEFKITSNSDLTIPQITYYTDKLCVNFGNSNISVNGNTTFKAKYLEFKGGTTFIQKDNGAHLYFDTSDGYSYNDADGNSKYVYRYYAANAVVTDKNSLSEKVGACFRVVNSIHFKLKNNKNFDLEPGYYLIESTSKKVDLFDSNIWTKDVSGNDKIHLIKEANVLKVLDTSDPAYSENMETLTFFEFKGGIS